MSTEERKKKARERAAKWRAAHPYSVTRYEKLRRGKRIARWKELEGRLEALERRVGALEARRGIEL